MTTPELSASKVKLVDFNQGWAAVEAKNVKLVSVATTLAMTTAELSASGVKLVDFNQGWAATTLAMTTAELSASGVKLVDFNQGWAATTLAMTTAELSASGVKLVDFNQGWAATTLAMTTAELSASGVKLVDFNQGWAATTLAMAIPELSASKVKLVDFNQGWAATTLAMTTAELSASKVKLVDFNQGWAAVEAKNAKLISMATTLAMTTPELPASKVKLVDYNEGWAATTLAMTSAELSASKVKLVDFEKGWAVVEADNAKLRELGEVLQGEVDAKRAVLAAIARLPRTQKSKATDKEQKSRVTDKEQVCDAPLPLCGPLLAAIVDSKRLTHLALDMDSGREAVWEKTGLRIACLAAALALNDSIQSLELTGWTWDESGSGSALAFLPLGSQRRMGSLNAGIRHEGLSSVKIDTRLFDAESALALSEQLQQGGVDLKLLPPHTNLNPVIPTPLSEYGLMIKDAVHKPTDISSAPLYRTSAPPRLPGAGTSPSTPPHSTSSLASATKSATVDVVATQASVTPVDSDLSDEGLESHHMVIIMVVLMQCPHLRRLRLGLVRNCVQVTGAKHVAAALQSNSSLLKLDISGQRFEGLGAAGDKAMASILRHRFSMLCCMAALLDISGQRFEGLGAAGVEAIASIISHRSSVSALEELNLSSCNMGPSGGAALAGALRSAGGRGPRGPIALRRLLVSQNGLDVAATKELRAAASERTNGLGAAATKELRAAASERTVAISM
eukprot:gene5246-18476_t